MDDDINLLYIRFETIALESNDEFSVICWLSKGYFTYNYTIGWF